MRASVRLWAGYFPQTILVTGLTRGHGPIASYYADAGVGLP